MLEQYSPSEYPLRIRNVAPITMSTECYASVCSDNLLLVEMDNSLKGDRKMRRVCSRSRSRSPEPSQNPPCVKKKRRPRSRSPMKFVNSVMKKAAKSKFKSASSVSTQDTDVSSSYEKPMLCKANTCSLDLDDEEEEVTVVARRSIQSVDSCSNELSEDFGDVKEKASSNEVMFETRIPMGLSRRSPPEELAAQLSLGGKKDQDEAAKYYHELKQRATLQRQLPNYAAYVSRSVTAFRRRTLGVTDATFSGMHKAMIGYGVKKASTMMNTPHTKAVKTYYSPWTLLCLITRHVQRQRS